MLAMDATDSNHTYNDCHRIFMQAMLSHRILKEEDAEEIYDRACEVTNREKIDFIDFVATINRELSDLDYCLRRSHNERDGHAVVAFVNTTEDENAQLATRYSPNDIAYFRQLMEAIVLAENEDFSISSLAALELGNQMKPPLGKKDTQELLDNLVSDEWLFLSRSGKYALDARAVMELQGLLREQYGDAIKECHMCLDVLTVGERCGQHSCVARMHHHCADRYFAETSNAICPVCSHPWSRDNMVGLL